jgi:hypothetical protein
MALPNPVAAFVVAHQRSLVKGCIFLLGLLANT